MNNELQDIFDNHTGRLVRKWVHYFDIYERHFRKYRNTDVTILEIGVCDGGSLQLWREYFGIDARIIGVDVDPRCKAFEDDNIEIHIGSQNDREFLRRLKSRIPKIDILIDDGGHTMSQQIATFEELFDHVKEDGVYLCEDMHTSYWPLYGGGHKAQGTFIEYCKSLVDQLNAWHARDESLTVDFFTRTAVSIHFYDSVTVIEKKIVEKPIVKGKGRWNYTPQDLEKVLAIYDEEIKSYTETPLWMLSNYGDALLQAGRLEEARAAFLVCLDKSPSASTIHLKLGQVAKKAGAFSDAIYHGEQALSLKPSFVPALLLLAEANAVHDNQCLSKQYLEEILSVNPEHPSASKLLNELA